MPNAGECIAGRYRLECPLGEGGMGSVWRARHLELDSPIAVKFQHAHRARSKGAAARFRKEARAAARLKSANVVRVVDFGIDGDVPYLAMELLEGESLKARLERQPLSSPETLCDVIRQAASALDAAHEAGIVHRDFKPSNLFLVPAGEREIVKLLDFGIAKWVEAEHAAEGALTEDDLVVGSVHYMSPEQARGELVDPRSDVWSLAVVAYEALTGLVPFRGANIPDTLRRICAGRFELPSRVLSAAYAPFDPVFRRAFELELDLRFETAVEFSTALAAAAGNLQGVSVLAPATPSAGGWAFGRDGATLSVPLARATRRWRLSRRWAVLVAAATVGVGGILVLVSQRSGTGSTAPISSTRAARADVPVAAVASPAAQITLAGPVTVPSVQLPADFELRPAVPATRAKRRVPLPAPSPATIAEPPPASRTSGEEPREQAATAPAPSATVIASPATHVHPVFGLEVQTPR